jgi:hypothetical protein
MRANDHNTSFLLERQDEDTTSSATNRIKISRLRTFLRNLHSLSLSEKGRANVCQRFKITDEELAATLAKLQRPNAPTDELLSIIGTAVTRTSKGKEGRAKW